MIDSNKIDFCWIFTVFVDTVLIMRILYIIFFILVWLYINKLKYFNDLQVKGIFQKKKKKQEVKFRFVFNGLIILKNQLFLKV